MPTADQILADEFNLVASQFQEIMLHPTGRTDRQRAFTQADAASRHAQVRKILRQLKLTSATITGPAITDAYRTGRAEAADQLIESGIAAPGEPFKGSFNLIDEESLKVVARDTAADLNKAADSMADMTTRVLRATAQAKLSEADINKIIIGGIITGDRDGAIRRLKQELIRAHGGKIITVIDKNGQPMHFKAGYYARMVMITKMRQAVTIAAINRFRAAGIFLVAITGKVSQNFCTAFLDKVFYIGDGAHPKYPHYNTLPGGGPPFHPNCSKGVRAFIEDLASPAQIDAAAGAPDADKLLKPAAPGKPSPAITPERRMSIDGAQRIYKDLQIRQQVEAIQTKLDRTRNRFADAVQAVVAQAQRLGVKRVDIAAEPNVGRKVVSALARGARRGLRPPAAIKVVPDGGDDVIFDIETDTLTANAAAEIWQRGRREVAVIAAIVGPRYDARVQQSAGTRNDGWRNDEDRRIAAKLGAKAARSPRDFIIEARSRLYAGELLAGDVAKLYRRLT